MDKFEEITKMFPNELSSVLFKINSEQAKKIQEIRIRVNQPLLLVTPANLFFITPEGGLSTELTNESLFVRRELFERIYKRLTEYSVHSNMNTLTSGFLTMRGGNRVGVCSTAVYKNESIYSVKNVTSLNIRVAREYPRCSLPLLNSVCAKAVPSIIIAGRPASGKTTVLRDIALQLSSGYQNKYRKVVIVDERSEIANMNNELCPNQVGVNTDVLNGFSKSDGIEIAVRTLSPEVILCDEIGNTAEVEAIKHGFSSGVNFIVSVHAANEKDLYQKPQIRSLLQTHQFQYIVLLQDHFNGFEIYNANEVHNEITRTAAHRAMQHFYRPE